MKGLKQLILLVILLSFLGCATAKGVVDDVKGIPRCIGSGWDKLKQADQWFQDHAW